MKKIVLMLMLTCSMHGFAQLPNFNQDLDEIVCREQAAHRFLQHASISSVPDNYDLKYHRFEWFVDPAVANIAGSVTSYVVPKLAGLDVIEFDLATTMTVDSVIHQGSTVSFSQITGDILQINLPSPIPLST